MLVAVGRYPPIEDAEVSQLVVHSEDRLVGMMGGDGNPVASREQIESVRKSGSGRLSGSAHSGGHQPCARVSGGYTGLVPLENGRSSSS